MIITVTLFVGCGKEFLEYIPKGTVSEELLNTSERLDQLVTAAYASLGNDDRGAPYSDMWNWGSVRSDDAYKGGGSIADGGHDGNEQFVYLTTTERFPNSTWVYAYQAISRANDALRRMESITEDIYPKKTQRQAELRFIRGHFHFVLKILFKYPPFATDKVEKYNLKNISNREYTNDELWDKIAEDFQFAVNNLPESQDEVGRANKFAAYAYLARVRLYQAYEQDEQHNVTGINSARLQEVVDLTDIIINSNKYALFDDIGKNYLWEYENGIESIFAVQYSIDDGTTTGRLDQSTSLNYNMAPEYGCCDFHTPSQNMVNAFKTDANGLPLFDTFNDTEMKDSADFMDNNVDPRLDHTVGIPGHPFKYDPEFIYKESWARAKELYGPFGTMKELQHPDCPCTDRLFIYFIGSAKNFDILRYNNILLWKAEALIELGRQDEALPIINQIRERAKNSTEMLKYSNGDYVSNYYIETYQPGVNCTWTQDFARTAYRWERRLEQAMECWRFFDLVRWGIAAETLNGYFEVEKIRRPYLQNAYFAKNRDEYLGIPEQQIDFSEGLYTQNYGW